MKYVVLRAEAFLDIRADTRTPQIFFLSLNKSLNPGGAFLFFFIFHYFPIFSSNPVSLTHSFFLSVAL